MSGSTSHRWWQIFALYSWPESGLRFRALQWLAQLVSKPRRLASSKAGQDSPATETTCPPRKTGEHQGAPRSKIPNQSEQRSATRTPSQREATRELRESVGRTDAKSVVWLLTVYRLPKRGNELVHCDDAWAWATNEQEGSSSDPEHSNSYYFQRDFRWRRGVSARLAIAISDGASDSFASNRWASLLTRHAVNEGLENWYAEKLPSKVHEVATQWRRSLSLERLPWYAAAKAEMGAHATLLVFETKLDLRGRGTEADYCVLAIGDSCFFHFREGRLYNRFPDLSPEEFGNTPDLIGTEQDYNCRVLTSNKFEQSTQTGQWQAGDEIWLATDSFAAWIAEKCRSSNGLKPSVDTKKGQFVTFLATLRDNGQMRNDDVTFVQLVWRDPTAASTTSR